MTDLLERFRSAIAERYSIERELGQGGMAWVYLAHDTKHRRPVAIKVLRPELGEAIGADRFMREIEIAARLTHPHILPLHDSGEAAGLLYYVMPFIEGESLRDRLQREVQLPLDDALKITREIADALAYAHACGVVHRDVKPENILLKSGHAFIADFGIARAVSSAGEDKLTVTGMSLGTPAYMSPEQVEGGQIDGRSDLYSLACVLFEALAGEPPFRGPNAQANSRAADDQSCPIASGDPAGARAGRRCHNARACPSAGGSVHDDLPLRGRAISRCCVIARRCAEWQTSAPNKRAHARRGRRGRGARVRRKVDDH